MESSYSEHILQLWDSTTNYIEQVFDSLIEGKSEQAAVLLCHYLDILRGDSRRSLVEWLESLETMVELEKSEYWEDEERRDYGGM